MYILLFILLTFSSAFAQPMTMEEKKATYLEEIRGHIPQAMYLKIKSMKFEKYRPDGPTGGFFIDLNEYYSGMQLTADQIMCTGKIPEVLEVDDVSDFFNAIKRSFVKFSETVPCNQNSKSVVSLAELNKVFDQLKEKEIYNNDHPNGMCFSRTYLISKELDDLGIKSQQLQISGWIMAAYKKGMYYGTEGYPIHKANLVTVDTGEGEEIYVVDPMYFDRPISLEQYKKIVSIPSIKNQYLVLSQDDNEALYKSNLSREKIVGYKSCTYNKYILEEEKSKVMLPADEFYYTERHKMLEADKFKSREEAIAAAKKKIDY